VSRGGAFSEVLPLTRHQEAIVILLPTTLVVVPADTVIPAPVTETEEILLTLPEGLVEERLFGFALAKGVMPEVAPQVFPSLARAELALVSFETTSLPLDEPELAGIALDFVQVVDYYGVEYRAYTFQVLLEVKIDPQVIIEDSVRSFTPFKLDTDISRVMFYATD
jgi:hypothetical protein